MAYKTEIKVYLPIKLVGELERYKRTGSRSSFIETAIEEKLHGLESFSLSDKPIHYYMIWIRDNAKLGPFETVFMQSLIDKELGN